MKKILLLSSIFLASVSFAQLENANWCFGINARVNFNPLPPSSTSASAIGWGNPGSSVRGSSVSNNAGQLLFYTDGINIWNGSNQQILNGANGNGIYGWSSIGVQNSLIVPKPGYPNLYYVFTLGSMGIVDLGDTPLGRGGIHYSVVDMSNGTGQVVSGLKNISIKDHNGVPIDYAFDYAHTEDNPVFLDMRSRMTTTIHADGEKIWVSIIPDFYFNHQHTRYFYNFLVTKDGINGLADGISPQPYVSSLLPASNYGTNWLWSCGSMKISPNGQFMCDAEEIVVNLYDYNNTNGTITLPPTTVFNPGWNGYHSVGFGIEFSPDSKLIYFTDNPYGFLQSGLSGGGSVPLKDHASLYQYDIQSQRLRIIYDYPSLSSDIITPLPVEGPFGIQLGIDNKIYVCAYGHLQEYRDNLGVINNPNVLGAGCNFVPDGFQLMPNTFQNGFLPQWVHKANVCVAPVVTPSGPIDYYYLWEYGSYGTLGVKLTSNNAVGNQWYKNGIQISNATQQIFIAHEAGNYTVSVNNCLSNTVVVNTHLFGSSTSLLGEHIMPVQSSGYYCINTTDGIKQFDMGSAANYTWNTNPFSYPIPAMQIDPSTYNIHSPNANVLIGSNPLLTPWAQAIADLNGVQKVLDYHINLYPFPPQTLQLCRNVTYNFYSWYHSTPYTLPGATKFDFESYDFGPNGVIVSPAIYAGFHQITIPGNSPLSSPLQVQFSNDSYVNYHFYYSWGGCYQSNRPVQIICGKSVDANKTIVYPNPATNLITLTSSRPIYCIEISALLSPITKTVKINGSKTISISLYDLKPGVYSCRITTGEGVENQRVIIKR